MKDFLFIAWGAGLQDGLNPCIFMTCAVFLAQRQWLERKFLRIGWLSIVFVVIYWISSLIFSFGPGQIVVFQRNFISIAKIIYFILGVWSFVLGVVFFKEWLLLRRGKLTESQIDEKTKSVVGAGVGVRLAIIIIAVVLSAVASLWPINSYVLLLGSAAILKGEWLGGMVLLGNYVLATMWPLWFVWAFIVIKNLRSSLLKIVCSSIFFTASSCVILMFK